MEHFSLVDLCLIFFITTLGATLQGALGYGLALIVSPVLILIDPYLVPGPLSLAAFCLVILVILRDRQALEVVDWRWGMLGMISGLSIGALILLRFSQENLGLVFGVLILLAVLLSMGGIRPPLTRATLLIAGLLAGVMGITTVTGGPPLALVYQDAPGKQLRAVMSGYFILGAVFALGLLAAIGRLGLAEVRLTGYLLPGILIGFLSSNRLARWVDHGYTRPAVLALSGVAALAVIINHFL